MCHFVVGMLLKECIDSNGDIPKVVSLLKCHLNVVNCSRISALTSLVLPNIRSQTHSKSDVAMTHQTCTHAQAVLSFWNACRH